MHCKAIVTKTVWYWTRGRKNQKQSHSYSITCDPVYVKGNGFAVPNRKTFWKIMLDHFITHMNQMSLDLFLIWVTEINSTSVGRSKSRRQKKKKDIEKGFHIYVISKDFLNCREDINHKGKLLINWILLKLIFSPKAMMKLREWKEKPQK